LQPLNDLAFFPFGAFGMSGQCCVEITGSETGIRGRRGVMDVLPPFYIF